MKRILLALGLLALMVSCTKKDWKDSSLPASERAALLLKEMTLEEKVGQMCQYVAPCYVPPGQGSPYKNIDATDENLGNKDLADKIRRGEVGSFLHCLTSKEAIALQELAQESRLKVPLLIGIDAIHGNALIEGCTVYPTNINLASTFNPELLETIGAETAAEMRQRGLYWTFGPNLDVSRDPRWQDGRDFRRRCAGSLRDGQARNLGSAGSRQGPFYPCPGLRKAPDCRRRAFRWTERSPDGCLRR